MVLKIRKKSIPETLVLFVFVMPFAFFLLMDVLRLGSVVKYTIDVAWILLLLLMLRFKLPFPDAQTKRLAAIAGGFFLFSIVGALMNPQSPFYYLWGLRNNLRFFVFFFSCVIFLERRYIKDYLALFDVIFWVNVPIVLFQYFVLGLEQDYLGGIFGTEKGCNAYTTIFFAIVVARSLLMFLNYREKKLLCLSKCVTALLISAIAELKFFFFVFVAIVIMAFSMTRLTMRKLGTAVLSIFGVYVAIVLLVAIFPEYAGWFNIESIIDTAVSNKGYTLTGDMNRLTTFTISFERFLLSVPERLFGLGLGNCDHASFEFLTTPFYRDWGHLNYAWFSSAYLMLETGIVGTLLYASFFVAHFFFSAKKQKSMSGDDIIYCQLSKITAVIAITMIVYNASMRMESGYMVYFVLALPFIRDGGARKNVEYDP